MRIALLVLLVMLPMSQARATEYHVGPGQAHTAIGMVPWESLAPGDTVLIHARPTPYAEKWVLAARGTSTAPITVRGVPDAAGNLPVIVGENATTRSQLDYWGEERGILKIGGANKPAVSRPSWLVVEGLHLRRARGAFTGRDGASTYGANAAALFVESGDHITIRSCILEDSGNGLFVASSAADVLVERNHLLGNGNPGSTFEHNAYTEALGITYQFNRFGPLCGNCPGNNLKDRSAGTVIRYNWLEGGNRQLDLVDAVSATLRADPSYARTFVYGNVLLEPDGAGNPQIVHFGGDSGTTANYRGTLYFFQNTVVSYRVGRTTLLRLSDDAQVAHVTGNVVLTAATGGHLLALSDGAGTVRHGGNWYKPGHVPCFCTPTGGVEDTGGNLTGESPGFVDLDARDFRLAPDTALRGASVAPPPEADAHPVRWQYVRHAGSEPRPEDGPLDIGAFGVAPSGSEEPDAGSEGPDAGTGAASDAGVSTGLDGSVPEDGTGGPPASGAKGCGAADGLLGGPLALALLHVLLRGRRRAPMSGQSS